MKAKDILTVTSVALGTATLTVATFWSGSLDAGIDAAPPATIAKPSLVSHGVEMTIAAVGSQVFKAGEPPVFELTAVNTTNQDASAAVCVAMTSSAPADRLSRVIRMPSMLWQQEQVVTLKPGETRVYGLSTRTNLPAFSLISVSLREVVPKRTGNSEPVDGVRAARPFQPGIVALSFSTVAPGGVPAFASLKLPN
jgi:hypothetical protein